MFRHISIIAVAVFLLAGCNSISSLKEERIVRSKADSVLATMSLREKVAQLFIVELDRTNGPETLKLQDSLVREGVGGIILMRGPIAPFIERANVHQSKCKIPILVCTDAEWGPSMRFPEYISYPRNMKLGQLVDREDLLYRMGLNVGQDLKDLNIYLNLAPCADISPYSVNKGDGRSFGYDREIAAKYSTAYMKGMQDAGIFACGKHYPGHGDTQVDSHYDLPVLPFDKKRIDSLELYPFKRMIDNGLAVVMLGHLSIPTIDDSGVPMSISKKCINGVLRGEQGFKGLVLTDALCMKGVLKGRTQLEANLTAYKAGVDMFLMTRDEFGTINAIVDSVQTGAYPLEELDTKVRRVLELKARAGFFKSDFSPVVTDLDAKIAAARERDSLLVSEIEKALAERNSAKDSSEFVDGTLVLDRGN